MDGSSDGASGNSSDGGAPDSGADTAAGDALGGVDAAGDSGDGGGAIGYDSATGDGATGCGAAAVSFKSDVIPVFQMSCTLTSVCHGQMGNVGEESLYLGENQGATDANAVYGMLVGVAAKEDPSMPLVTANSTDNSYLYHKLLGDQNTLAASCMKAASMCSPDCNPQQPCGGLMPYSGELLSATDPAFLCTIKTWIDTGAQNN